jgi:hypothetical protein
MRKQISSSRTLGLFMAACALVAGCALLWASGREIAAHADVTYPEAAVAYNAHLAAQTGRVYPPISQPPYTPAVYGPAYYLGLAGIARAGSLDLDQVLLAGRALSLLAFGLVIAAAWFLARSLGAPALFATLAASLVFAEPTFFRMNNSARPDVVALALVAWAMVLAVRNTDYWRRFALVGLLMSCSVMVKAPYVAGLLAVIAWLILSRRWKAVAAFFGGAFIPAAFFATWLRAHGDPLLGGAGLLEAGFTDPVGAILLIGREVFHYWPHVVILIAVVALARNELRLNARRPGFLVALYCGLSWIVAALTLVNSGGNVNYLLEPWFVSSVLFAVALAAMPRLEGARRWAVPAVCAITAIAGTVHGIRIARAAAIADYSGLASISNHRLVLSDVSYLSARGEGPELLDPFLSGQLERAGRWDDQPILDELQQEHFDFVALTSYHGRLREYRRNPFVSPRLLAEIAGNYAPFCETAGQGPQRSERLLVWLPKHTFDATLAAELNNSVCERDPNPGLLREIASKAAQAAPARVAKK